MFPDLRLLISATVATFFLAATAGLYASLRVTQDQIAPRSDSRAAIEDSPIARIAATWPIAEPDRVAAMRELMIIAKAPPMAATEPADMPDAADVPVAPEAIKPDTPPIDSAVSEETPIRETTSSTGTAVQPDISVNTQSAHLDIQGNIGEAPEIGNAGARAAKTARPVVTKVRQVAKKRSARIVQRRKIARTHDHQIDPLLSNGYPLYLIVPITN